MSERLELNDELLCAYMDGELDAEMHARVERALVDDAGARVRLERMRVADERLKAEIPLPRCSRTTRCRLAFSVSVASQCQARRGVAAMGCGVITALAAGIGGVLVGFVLSRPQRFVRRPSWWPLQLRC